MFVGHSPESWLLSIRSVLATTTSKVVVGVLHAAYIKSFEHLGPRVSCGMVGSISELINTTYRTTRGDIVVVNDAVVLPPDPFGTAMAWAQADVRVSTVSFLGNASEAASFPVRNLAQPRPIDGHDEVSITRTLRDELPRQRPAPSLLACGPVVFLTATGLGAVGQFEAPASARFDIAIADYSARSVQKGFTNLIDTSTYITRPSDTALEPIDDHLCADDTGWLLHRYRWLIGTLDEQRTSGDSAFAHQFQLARVKVEGLRILVDGSCLGPHETGTQVATVQTIAALERHRGVAWVGVALPGPIPTYADDVLRLRNVDARPTSNPADFGIVDIAFRPFQPVIGYDSAPWRRSSVRYALSILDVIAHANGSYFPDAPTWTSYRNTIDAGVQNADVVTVISADVRSQMHLHGFAIEDERIVVAPLGTEHLDTTSVTAMPRELEARQFGGRRFAVVLGVNYHHKNREMAIAAHRELRSRGHDLALVMAGPAVPYGTTRLAESAERVQIGTDSWLFVLPELPEEERNWLLSHAALAWYPTSAEGFGLPPFEAAAFDVPAVSVGFGPLRELAGSPGVDELPLFAQNWTPSALAAVAQQLLDDPALARAHCAALRASGRHYSWDQHGDRLVAAFRVALSTPRRRSL